jgi:phage tail-like protein
VSGGQPAFRLLDGRVGWDPRPGDGLAGAVVDGGVLRLADATPGPAAAPGGARCLLARSRDGSWWLAGRHGLRRLGPCDDRFREWRETRRVRALAARGRRVAVVLESGLLLVFDTATGQVLAEAWAPGTVRVRLDGRGGLDAVDRWGRHTWFDPSGLRCKADEPCRPGADLPPQVDPWPPDPPGVVAGEDGFCLDGRGCFDWEGRPLPGSRPRPAGATYLERGQYLSVALDSGLPGCRWHRIRIDADVPDGTGVELAFATTDGEPEGRPPAAGAPGPWSGFPAGDPHPSDWFPVRAGAADSTLSAAPGRYGYLRIRLTGDGAATPVVHQVRIDLPGATGLDRLPQAYSEDPTARDFSERFLSLFDAHLEELDAVLDSRAALLDADALPDDALGWLAGLLGIGFEAEMPVARRRALLRAAPDLFRRRGTPQGLVDILQVALGVSSSVEELGAVRPWAGLGGARLGATRLFGRSRARLRLGTSRLGRSRLQSGGNPDHDAVLAGAHRIRVHVPAGADAGLVGRVVRSQIPAHVVPTVTAAVPGLVAGILHVGIDTVLTAPAPAVVGSTALGRSGVVRSGRSCATGAVVGQPLVVGQAPRHTELDRTE